MIVPMGNSRLAVGRNAAAAKARKKKTPRSRRQATTAPATSPTSAANANQACRSWPDDRVQPNSVTALYE